MALYETVFIARQDVSSAQIESLANDYAGIIASNGGEVKKTEHWGLRSLSYKIKKNRKGHYVMFNIDAPSAAVLELERNMRLNEDILRFMTIKVDALEEGESIVLRTKDTDKPLRFGEKPPRPDRGERRHRDSESESEVKKIPEASEETSSETKETEE